MGKVILSLVIAVVALSANAQVYLGGSFGITHDSKAEATNFIIAPEVGYNFNEKWAVASEIGFSHYGVDGASANIFFIAPYARYSFFEKNIFRLFVDGGLGFSTATGNTNGFQIGFKPGIAIKASEHFSFVAKYGFLGYRDEYLLNSVSGLSLSSDDLSIGFHYEF